MPYSAVIQPRAWPLSQGGRRSSRVAVTRTWVSPNFTKQDPSAYLTTPRSRETARNSSVWRRLGRMKFLPAAKMQRSMARRHKAFRFARGIGQGDWAKGPGADQRVAAK